MIAQEQEDAAPLTAEGEVLAGVPSDEEGEHKVERECDAGLRDAHGGLAVSQETGWELAHERHGLSRRCEKGILGQREGGGRTFR